MRQKEPLRALSQQEERELQRVVKASSERGDVVKRAKALVAVSTGKAYTEAAKEAGMKSGDSVSQLVGRFNQKGLAALLVASGRGRKETYRPEQRVQIVEEVQREPERKADQTATWSLSRLQRSLRRSGLPRIGRETIRLTLHEAGYRYQRTRTWVRTGYALRKRKSGTVTTYDPETPEKKDGSSRRTSRPKRLGLCSSMKMRRDPTRPCHSPGSRGSWRATPLCRRTSTSAAAPPNC